jgi:hypothetical protein
MQAATQMQIGLDSLLSEYTCDMYARVGISMGDVCAGVMDGRSFRVFGQTVHMSQRLEAACPRHKIACQSCFYKLLSTQLGANGPASEVVHAELKGFGKVEFNLVTASRAARSLARHFCDVRQSMALMPGEADAIRSRVDRSLAAEHRQGGLNTALQKIEFS